MVVLEQDQSLVGLEALEAEEQQQLELQQEVERLRSAQVQTERTLETRERAHRQRVHGLEEQVLRPDWARPSLGAAEPAGLPARAAGPAWRVMLEKAEGRGLGVTSWVYATYGIPNRRVRWVSAVAGHKLKGCRWNSVPCHGSGSRQALSLSAGSLGSSRSGYSNHPYPRRGREGRARGLEQQPSPRAASH